MELKNETPNYAAEEEKNERRTVSILYVHDYFNLENKFLLKSHVNERNTNFGFVVASILFYSMTFPFLFVAFVQFQAYPVVC